MACLSLFARRVCQTRFRSRDLAPKLETLRLSDILFTSCCPSPQNIGQKMLSFALRYGKILLYSNEFRFFGLFIKSFGKFFEIWKNFEVHLYYARRLDNIGRNNFCNLVRKKYIKRQKKGFSFSDFLLSFNIFLSHLFTKVLSSYDNVLASRCTLGKLQLFEC